MDQVLIILIVSTSFTTFAIGLQCPVGTISIGVDSVCVIATTQYATYCQAHQWCHAAGLLAGQRMFLVGRNVNKLLSLFSGLTSSWTSVNSLLEPHNSRKSGWRVGDPAASKFLSTEDSFHWFLGRPMYPNARIGMLGIGGLFDVTQNTPMNQIICDTYMNETVRNDSRTKEVFKRNWPMRLDSLYFDHYESTGCFNQSYANTLLNCAKL